MLVRPDRLLPSVIVGALLTGALALGAGTASADPVRCKAGERTFEVSAPLGADGTGRCLLAGVVAPVGAVLELLGDAATEITDELPPVVPSQTPAAEEPPAKPSADTPADQGDDEQPPGETGAVQGDDQQRAAEQQRAQQEAAQRAAAEAAQRAAQQQVARGAALAAPAAAAPGGLAATVPLLNFGTPNPALLLAPPGSPLRTLAGENTGSPVTTTSDVQAIAFDNMPGGMGTPAVVGVLILSTLGAFALRHRVLRRAGGTESSASSD